MIKRKTNAKNLSEGKRHFGVVLEHIDSKFNQVLDGHAALDKKIDNFREEVREELDLLKVGQKALASGQEALTERVDDLTGKVDDLTGKVEDLTKSSKQILEYLARIDDEIQDIKRRLDRKADLERLEILERRVAQIELAVKKYYESKNSN